MNENPTVAKDPARARLSGGIFELRLAGLVSARLRAVRRRRPNLNLNFLVATNMDNANPFDDVVVRLAWDDDGRRRALTYFAQLKHAEKVDKPVGVYDLTAVQVSKNNKDFNLRKYFNFFKKLKCMSDNIMELKNNERLLQEWAKDEYRFVLFTTRNVLPKKKEDRCTSPLDFPFEEVFSTDQGQAFCLGDSDEEVWNMMAGSPDEDVFRTEFLPKLRIFSAQAQVASLKPLLARGIQDLLDGKPPREEQLCSNYESFLQFWWNSDSGSCLTEQTTEIEDLIKDDINTVVQNLTFRSDFCNALAQRLNGSQASFIVIPGIQQELRFSAVRAVLTKTLPERFVILRDKIIEEYPREALCSVCDKLCDEIVICTDKLSDTLVSFVNKFVRRKDQNVRVLSSKWDWGTYSLLVSRFGQCDAWSERWTLECLQSDEQQRLLDRRVCFQGHDVRLSEIEQCSWPGLKRGIGGTALNSLAVGEVLTIGIPLPSTDEQYISRTVQHFTTLNRTVFNINNPNEHFMLRGFPEEMLGKLRGSNCGWQECSPLGIPLIRESDPPENVYDIVHDCKTKWTEIGIERNSNKQDGNNQQIKRQGKSRSEGRKRAIKGIIRKQEDENNDHGAIGKRNVHWISYRNDELMWDKSEGKTDCLKDHALNKSDNCKHNPICCHSNCTDFLTWEDNTLVLTDSAGMGKSTYITQLANVIKTANVSHWVIIIRMNEGQLMDKLPEIVELCHVLHILNQCSGTSGNFDETSANFFFRNCLGMTGNITILADGVDEVCPAHKTKALRLLKLLQEVMQKGGGRLWIASRTVLQEDLAQTLHKTTLLSMQPFSRHDQELYLRKNWSENVSLACDSGSNNSIKQLVSSIREATSTDGRSLCDVPLYMRMVAESYTGEEIMQFLKSDKVELAASFSRGALYKRFVEKTLGVVWLKAGIPESALLNLNITSQDALQKHAHYAALECFHDFSFLGKYFGEVAHAVKELQNELEREKIARTGIITHVVDGRPKFLHYTLAEYFAALWLQEKYSSLPELTAALYEGVFGEVRYFFDYLLTDDRAVHTAAMSGSVKTLCSVIYLKEHQIEEEDTGGRRALHLAAISGNADLVRCLIGKSAKASKRDKVLGWTPLRYMDSMVQFSSEDSLQRSIRYLEIVDCLLTAHVNLKDASRIFNEKRIFTIAIREDFPKITEFFIKKQGFLCIQKFQKKTYMHEAAEHDSLNVLHMLLRFGFGVNQPSPKHYSGTPLIVAAARGYDECCKILLRHGAKVDVPDRDGYTALHEAARKNHQDICEMLLEHGANPNAKNKEGETPLHQAAREGHLSTCQSLLDSGASPDASDKFGNSPLDEAARWGRQLVIKALVHDENPQMRYLHYHKQPRLFDYASTSDRYQPY